MARRRRDLSRSSRYFRSLLWFSFLLFSFFSLNLPKNPILASSSVFFLSDRKFCIGVREQCLKISLNQTSPTNLSQNRATEGLLLPVKPVAPRPLESSTVHGDALNKAESSCVTKAAKLISEETISNGDRTTRKTYFLHQSNEDAADQICRLIRSGKQTKSDPVSRDDAAAQIWGLYHAGKQIKPDSALRPSSRHSATNPSPVSHLKVRPLPPPSTLTPALPSPSPACRSMANPSCLSLPSTRTPASTQHPVRPSIMTPASTQQLGGGASDTSTTEAALGFGLLGLRHCSGPPWLSRPNVEHTISSTSLIRPKTKPLFPNYVEMCLLVCLPRSESFAYDLAQESQMVYDRRPPMSSVTLFI